MNSDDRTLIADFQGGDYHAFDTLYERYARRVLAFACQITGDPSEAEDLTQEVFIGAFKGLQGFRNQSRVLTWLFSIAVRRWRDKQRHQEPKTVPYPMEGDLERLADPSLRHNDLLQNSMERVSLQEVVAGLNAPLREAFWLVVVQELTCREAAQVLNCPLGTIKWRAAEALRQVRAGMQAKEEENVPCLHP